MKKRLLEYVACLVVASILLFTVPFALAESIDNTGLINLARLEGVEASCVNDDGTTATYCYSNFPSNAIDGKDNLNDSQRPYYQAAQSNPLANLQIDLKETYEIHRICINGSSNNYATSFSLEVSANGIDWNPVYQSGDVTSAPNANEYQEYTFTSAVSARYVRMNVKANKTEWPATIFEFQIWGKSTTQENDEGLVNLAPRGDASCVTDDGNTGGQNVTYWHAPVNAIDNNNTSFFQAHDNYKTADLYVDLKDDYQISKISILCNGTNWPKEFKLDVSVDGTNWTNVKNESLTDKPTDWLIYTFNEVSARYVRMDITENGGTYAAAIYEFQIWGSESETVAGDIDLALNGSATMDYPYYESNGTGHPASCAIDGNYNSSTYAQSAEENASWSLTVDLNAACDISSFKLETSKKNHAKDFAIEISNDGTNWSAVDTVTNFGGGIYEKSMSTSVRARYVRMHVTAVETEGWGHTIFYFSVYGTYAQINLDDVDLGTAINRNACTVVSSSEQAGHPANNVLDGDIDTFWEPNASGKQTLTIDLQKCYDFTGIFIQGHLSTPGFIQIDTSEDNLRWYSDTKQLMTSNGVAIEFPQDYRRYVRITFPSNAVSLQVSEISFFGAESNLAAVLTVMENETASRPVLFPIPDTVTGVSTPVVSLDGDWTFALEPELGYWQENTSRAGWTQVVLPGDAFAQGYIPYSLSENDSGYQHESAFEKIVTIPLDFSGQRVVLRINGAINYSRLWVNGEIVCTHRSGKTSWEADITDYVMPGSDARITIGLTAENPQVDFSRVRGITGNIVLYALPENHLSRLHVVTDLDENYNNAEMTIQIGELFHGAATNSTVMFTLTDPSGNSVPLENNSVIIVRPDNGDIQETTVTYQITSPIKWDSEHPNLYTLTADLYNGTSIAERVSINVGFREIEIDGTIVKVNGDPIKLRGANLTPSSPNIGVAADDAWIFEYLTKLKAANVNFIRTAHAPLTEYFYALCDEMGFYVESEASIFFIGMDTVSHINPDSLKNDERYSDCYLNAVAEMIEEFKTHPSILYWSIGNESNWGSNNELCHTYARAADPTRPTKFSWGYEIGNSTELFSGHYNVGIASNKPIIEDEFAHGSIAVNEERLDPGYQDCAETIDNLWNIIYQSNNYLGGAIWAGNDRMTYTIDGKVNWKYNTSNGNGWGFLDVWNREKPGYWNVKKAYSPFKIQNETQALTNPGSGNTLSIPVENRFNHSNLNECIVAWNVGSESGSLTGPNIEKRASGNLVIPARNWENGDVLNLTITYQGIVIDEYSLTIGQRTEPDFTVDTTGTPVIDTENFTISGENFSIVFDQATGLISSGSYNNKQLICGGPFLNLGTGVAGAWSKTSMSFAYENGKAVATISGFYSSGISATFVLKIDNAGLIETTVTASGIGSDYSELGVAYVAPSNVISLSWQRNGYWSTYPEDHISRNEGTALKEYINGYITPTMKPDGTWAQDMQNYFMFGDNDQGGRGSNDFRSRKTNYYYVTLNYDNGGALRAENEPAQKGTSDGTTASARAQVQSNGTIRFNLNTIWMQKGSFDSYSTPTPNIANGYTGTVKMRMMDVWENTEETTSGNID